MTRSRNLSRKLLILAFYLLTAGVVLFVFVVNPGINDLFRAKFLDMVYWRAWKPFVYRMLLPTTVRVIAGITPESVKEACGTALGDMRMVEILGWETEGLYEYIVALALMLGCYVGFAYALRSLIRHFYDYPAFVSDLAPLGGLLVLVTFFRYSSFIYDPPTLFLFTLAVLLIATRRRLLFYFIFVLATLNKETSVLLIGVFFIREFREMRTSRLAGHLLLQAYIWGSFKARITTLFFNNPGSFVEYHLTGHNLRLLSMPYSLLYFVGVILIFALLIRPGWSKKPAFLRHGLIITIVPLMLLALFLGLIDELRGYYEAYPFLFLLSLPTIVDVFDIPRDTPQKE